MDKEKTRKADTANRRLNKEMKAKEVSKPRRKMKVMSPKQAKGKKVVSPLKAMAVSNRRKATKVASHMKSKVMKAVSNPRKAKAKANESNMIDQTTQRRLFWI